MSQDTITSTEFRWVNSQISGRQNFGVCATIANVALIKGIRFVNSTTNKKKKTEASHDALLSVAFKVFHNGMWRRTKIVRGFEDIFQEIKTV